MTEQLGLTQVGLAASLPGLGELFEMQGLMADIAGKDHGERSNADFGQGFLIRRCEPVRVRHFLLGFEYAFDLEYQYFSENNEPSSIREEISTHYSQSSARLPRMHCVQCGLWRKVSMNVTILTLYEHTCHRRISFNKKVSTSTKDKSSLASGYPM